MKNWFFYAALLAGLAVGLGAFGAHGLKKMVTPEQIEVFKTGVQYHFYHAVAIALASLASSIFAHNWITRSKQFFLLGIVFFAGSLYLMTFLKAVGTEGVNWLGAITPIGGVFFILGWLALAFGVKKS